MNGKPALRFDGTNTFALPDFASSWSQGEVFVVLQSDGTTNKQVGLWLMGMGSALYPQTTGQIQENFGRNGSSILTGYPIVNIQNTHLYNVMSKSGAWTNRLNNLKQFGTNANAVYFPSSPRLGRDGTIHYFRGHIWELLIFNRELTPEERNAVAENYLKVKFGLSW